MSDIENSGKFNDAQPPPPTPTDTTVTPPTGTSVITRTWKKDEMLKRGSVILRGLALLLSLLSFIIMATNNHHDWRDFQKYQEYKYVLAIAVLSAFYTLAQSLRHLHEVTTGKQLLQKRASFLLDFLGDQLMAYLVISSASSAVPMTNRMREAQDNIFTDALAASITMAFFAFFSLALSALISGHKLATESYI